MTDITRPIIGIENRSAQQVFDIMVDRMRSVPAAIAVETKPVGRAPDRGALKRVHRKLAEEGGGTWGTYMMLEIASAYGDLELLPDDEALAAFASPQPLLDAPRVKALDEVGADLLEALKEAIAGYEECSQYKGDYLRDKHGDDEEIAALKAVVAKAEGQP